MIDPDPETGTFTRAELLRFRDTDPAARLAAAQIVTRPPRRQSISGAHGTVYRYKRLRCLPPVRRRCTQHATL